jgi:hypothetical protein
MLYHYIMELLDHITKQMGAVPGPNAEGAEGEPHPYSKRYIQGRFGAQFLLRGARGRGIPIVWVTKPGRQTRYTGLYHPVQILALYPAQSQAGLSVGPQRNTTRQERMDVSTEYISAKDSFFQCFFSVGFGTSTRSPGHIIIIRAYLVYFTNLCKNQAKTKALLSDAARKQILQVEIIDGISLGDFFNTEKKASEHLKNVQKHYPALCLDGESTFENLENWKPEPASAHKSAVWSAAIRSVNHQQWNTMILALKNGVVNHAESQDFNTVSFLCGSLDEQSTMNTLIQSNKFKTAVIPMTELKGGLSLHSNAFGTLHTGVLTTDFVQQMNAIRKSWVRNRRIWLSKERTQDEMKAALKLLDDLILKNSNKKARADTYK